MAAEFDLFLKYATRGIKWQFNKDVKELEDRVKETPDGEKMLKAMIGLRRPIRSQRYDIQDMLFEMAIHGNSRYRPLTYVIDPDEYMRVPSSISEVLREAEFDILDDGYLRLVRIEGYYCAGICEKKPLEGEKFVLYRLVDSEYMPQSEIRRRILDIRPLATISSMKRMYFETLEKFARFLEAISDPELADMKEGTLEKRLDELMKPEKFDEWKEE